MKATACILLTLSISCWISTEDPKMGAIWAFAVPMLVVILINLGFLIAALVSLFRVRRAKMTNEKIKGGKEAQQLFK